MADTNEELIQELIKGGHLEDPLLIEAFRAIDRKNFMPPDLADKAYVNEAFSIGHGQTISQPLVVALMLQLLEPKPKERILDIGSGSGWQSALLGYVVSKEMPGDAVAINEDIRMDLPKGMRLSSLGLGEVVAIERIPELKKMTEENIEKYGFISKKVVHVLLGDATKGVSPEFVLSEGFDRIIAAASGEEIPVAWKNQLKVGGRIVAPVGHSIVVLDKRAMDVFIKSEYTSFNFVPLVSG